MAELTPQERLQPALLDRLTDDEPDKKQEPREQRVMSKQPPARRRCCAIWRGCSTPRGSKPSVDLSGAPHVRRSVHQLRPAGAVGPRRVVARRRRARARDPAGDPRLRAAHPAGHAAGQGARSQASALDHHNVIGVEIHGPALGPAGAARAARAHRDRPRDRPGRDRRSRARRGRPEWIRGCSGYYNLELQHLREMGAEFAQQFPKIAARLGMNGLEVADPVRRAAARGRRLPRRARAAQARRRVPALHAGAARDRLSALPGADAVDAGRAAQAGHAGDPNLADGLENVSRAARTMQSALPADDVTACEFRTAHDVTLWPIEIVSASYFSFAPDLPLNALPVAQRIKGGLRIRLKTTAGSEVLPDGARPPAVLPRRARRRRQQAVRAVPRRSARRAASLPAATGATGCARVPAARRRIRPVGFDDDEALLPVTLRSFQGYRLLQEYFAFPQRYRFFELSGLGAGRQARRRRRDRDRHAVRPRRRRRSRASSTRRTSRCSARRRSICSPSAPIASMSATARTSTTSCPTARGRWISRSTRSPRSSATARRRTASSRSCRSTRRYSADSRHRAHGVFHDAARAASAVVDAEAARDRGRATSAPRSSCRWSIGGGAVQRRPAAALGPDALHESRSVAADADRHRRRPTSRSTSRRRSTSIRVVSGPSRPHAPLADGAVAWRAISHLSLNYLSLVNTTPQEGAAALRELLELYAPAADRRANGRSRASGR